MFLTLMTKSRSLSPKTVLITGANEGIGFQIALALAFKGHSLIMADKNNMDASKLKIVKETGNCKIVTKTVDFTSLPSIRSFAQEVKMEEQRLDVLINNVGVFCLGKERTEEGLAPTMQVNHFGPFLLTNLLTDLLVKSAPSRVLFTSSLGAFFHNLTIDNLNNPQVCWWDHISSLLVYYNSKLCNMITANMFAERLKKYGVMVNSLHPGMSSTTLLWKNRFGLRPLRFLVQDPEMGAQSSVFLATSETVHGVSGKFFVDLKEHQQPKIVEDLEFCHCLWQRSEEFVGLSKEGGSFR